MADECSFKQLCGDEFSTIVAFGPKGGGKSTIMSHLLNERFGESKVVKVNCRLIATVQDLLWTIQTSLTKYFTDMFRLKKLPVWKRGRTYTIIDLANFLRSVIVPPSPEDDSPEVAALGGGIFSRHYDDEDNDDDTAGDLSTTTIYLFLENLSHIIEYETIFASLADLSRIAERRFQLFATVEVAPAATAGMLPSNFVQFPAHSLDQLRAIILRRVVKAAHWPASVTASDSSAAPDAATVDSVEGRGRLCFHRLQRLALQSMETLSLASTSIDLLTSAMMSLWLVLYGETPYASYHSYHHPHGHSSSSVSPLPLCNQGLVIRIVQEMIRRNRFNFHAPVSVNRGTPGSHHGTAQGGTISIDDAVYTELQHMVEQHFQSQAANAAATSSVGKGPPVAEKPTALVQHHFAQQASTMLPMEQHIQTLPYHLRVVLVAAFLAGHRGKAQDTLYDPSSQTFKRRRHSQQNSNIDHSQQIAGNNAGSATNSGKDIGAGVLQSSAHGQSLLSNSESALPNRELFTYERLSALYAHVLAYCHDTAPATGHYGSNARHHRHQGKVAYAKPTLQSLVTRLEMYGLLQAMPTVLPSYHPQRRLHCGYRATIARQVAVAAAENIGFPIESFVYSSYDFQPASTAATASSAAQV